MTKFKKMMSVTLAGCMAASALMMSAGAVDENKTNAQDLPFTVETSNDCFFCPAIR